MKNQTSPYLSKVSTHEPAPPTLPIAILRDRIVAAVHTMDEADLRELSAHLALAAVVASDEPPPEREVMPPTSSRLAWEEYQDELDAADAAIEGGEFATYDELKREVLDRFAP